MGIFSDGSQMGQKMGHPIEMGGRDRRWSLDGSNMDLEQIWVMDNEHPYDEWEWTHGYRAH